MLSITKRFQICGFQVLSKVTFKRQSIHVLSGSIVSDDFAPAPGEFAERAPEIDAKTEGSPLVIAPFKETGFLVGSQGVERTANMHFCHPLPRWLDVEIGWFQTNVIIPSRPQYKARRINYGRFPCVVRSHQDIETLPQLKT